MKGKRKAS